MAEKKAQIMKRLSEARNAAAKAMEEANVALREADQAYYELIHSCDLTPQQQINCVEGKSLLVMLRGLLNKAREHANV